MRTLNRSWWLALAGALVIAACGDSKSSLNPTAPSAISSDLANADTGAIDGGESSTTGRGNSGGGNSGGGNSGGGNGGGGNGGGGNGNSGGGNGGGNSGPGNGGGGNSGPGNGGGGNSGPGNGGGSNSGPGNGGGGNSGPGNGNLPPTSTKVELEGPVTSVGAASIAVNAQTVLVTSDTVIRHGSRRFGLSDISIGDRVHVKATRTASSDPGVPATLSANEIKLQNRDDDDDDDDDDDEDEDDDRAVTVMATDALASETGSNTGTFRLHRDRSNPLTQSPLTVTFTLNGTATNGVDYASVPLTATFPAGEDSINVVITPITDALVEGTETVVLTLTAVGPYVIGTPATAMIVLNDTAAAPASR